MCEIRYTYLTAQIPIRVVFCYACHSLFKTISTIGLCFPSNYIFYTQICLSQRHRFQFYVHEGAVDVSFKKQVTTVKNSVTCKAAK